MSDEGRTYPRTYPREYPRDIQKARELIFARLVVKMDGQLDEPSDPEVLARIAELEAEVEAESQTG